jgi:hypothetical protein
LVKAKVSPATAKVPAITSIANHMKMRRSALPERVVSECWFPPPTDVAAAISLRDAVVGVATDVAQPMFTRLTRG